MTLLQRRILTLFLFLLLISVGPGLIFYGAGYRINLEQKRIERVGLLHITTDPENTTITIDGQSHPIPDELVLSSLKPKEYDIVISKTDYHSWYKRLEIAPGESTFIRDLQLFLDTETEILETIDLNPSSLAVTNSHAYFQSGKSLIQFDFESETLNTIPLANQFEVIQLQADNKRAIFLQNAIWYYFDGTELVELDFSYLEENVLAIYMQSNTFYLVTKSGIYQTTLNSTEANLVVQQSFIQDVFIDDNTFWYIAYEPSKKHSFLYKAINEQSRPELITTIPYQTDYKIEENFGGFLTLSSHTNEQLILVDTNSLPAITEEIDMVKGWDWSKNEKQLLIATEFELFIIHFDEAKRQELLMRLSKPFTDALWEENETHALYIADEQLQLVERDERFQRNSLILTETFPNLSILAETNSGDEVYLTSLDENGMLSILKQSLR